MNSLAISMDSFYIQMHIRHVHVACPNTKLSDHANVDKRIWSGSLTKQLQTLNMNFYRCFFFNFQNELSSFQFNFNLRYKIKLNKLKSKFQRFSTRNFNLKIV